MPTHHSDTPSPRCVMRGLIAAPYTPFDRHSGDLKIDVIECYAEHLLNSGVEGAFVCGTTGEGVSLTIDERMQVAKRWVEVAGDSLSVIVHVGDLAQRNAVALASHARSIGAAGVAAMPAFFFKPSSLQGLIDFCRPIATAAGPVPFFYYHIPSMNGVVTSMVDFVESATRQIANFRGVKFTHGDLMEYTRCINLFGQSHEIAWGVDEMLLGALSVGATTAVGSTYNYAAPLYRKLIDAHESGDTQAARQFATQSCEMVAALLRHGVLRTGKATMAMIGVDCGPPRSPIAPLSNDEVTLVRETYARLGVIELDGRSLANATANGHSTAI